MSYIAQYIRHIDDKGSFAVWLLNRAKFHTRMVEIPAGLEFALAQLEMDLLLERSITYPPATKRFVARSMIEYNDEPSPSAIRGFHSVLLLSSIGTMLEDQSYNIPFDHSDIILAAINVLNGLDYFEVVNDGDSVYIINSSKRAMLEGGISVDVRVESEYVPLSFSIEDFKYIEKYFE